MAERREWWRYFAPGGRVFGTILGSISVYTLLVIWVDDHAFPAKTLAEVDGALYTSVVMGLLLVFRTNSAYDRWWEGRKLWGQLVNDMRNLSIKAAEYASLNRQERIRFGQLLIGFPHSLKEHLRGVEKTMLIPPEFREEFKDSKHVPMEVARLVYRNLRSWNKQGRLSDMDMIQLDEHARSLMDICGACERILKSPIAGSYKLMIWSLLSLYVITLPWMLVPTFELETLLVVLLSAYFVIGLELLAEDVEEPFGTNANDLPLEGICQTIEDSVTEVLGAPGPVPESTGLSESISSE